MGRGRLHCAASACDGCIDCEPQPEYIAELQAKLAAAEARAEKLKKDNAGMVNIITELQNDAAAIRPLLRRAYRYVSVNAIDARAEGGE